MIALGSRFADYGLTAGFMICLQLAFLFWFAPSLAHSIIVASATATKSYVELLPQSLNIVASVVLGAFAIIILFFVGLILALIGSVAVFWEANIFRKQLEHNRQWLITFLDLYGQGMKGDFDQFLSDFSSPWGKQEWLPMVRLVYFWKRSSWAGYFALFKREFRRFMLLRSFSRLQSFLLSYTLAADSTPKLDLLRDHIYLCGISRAISASLYILVIEGSVGLWFLQNVSTSRAIVFVSLSPFLLLLGIFLPIKAYTRFCDDLFSLVLVLYRKLNKEVSPQENEVTKTTIRPKWLCCRTRSANLPTLPQSG